MHHERRPIATAALLPLAAALFASLGVALPAQEQAAPARKGLGALLGKAADRVKEEAMKRFHVRLADGALVSGAAAFLALWRETPGFGLPARLLSARPMMALLDILYAGFLRLRRLWR